MPQITSIVFVGHCGADRWQLERTLAELERESVQLVSANSDAQLRPFAHPQSLWLVNRVLEGSFKANDGIALIAQYAATDQQGEPAEAEGNTGRPQMMLISNYPDAQAAAISKGALPGFGKHNLGPSVVKQIRAVIASKSEE